MNGISFVAEQRIKVTLVQSGQSLLYKFSNIHARIYIYIYMYMCVKLKAQARLLLIAMRASMFAKLVARIQAQLCFVPVSMFTPVSMFCVLYMSTSTATHSCTYAARDNYVHRDELGEED